MVEGEVIYNFVTTPIVAILFILFISGFVKWISHNKVLSKILFARIPVVINGVEAETL